MVDLVHLHVAESVQRLGREPTSADDIVVMISDVLCDYLSPDSGVSSREAIGRLLAIIETPLALEIYEREMERRHPRDVDRWH
ncbi:MAG TPA: hypothetical protein VGV07_18055 [Devosia sp.]|jgi:hypothetical protein|uniref:hypothetical protein n=1 Tax=Devosia sp. TaxID=1871048 RepID=UPI002DDCDF67|nr:hypothetical protein [Devosia sp.]HEV2517163.1 hypothetical protein [Devosia sp.]